MEDNTIKVTFGGQKRVDTSFKGMTVRTDQSEKNGGEGSAPEPFDVFLASLAACAGIYVLGFCQNRQLPTDGITLTQSHDYVQDEKGKSVLSRVSIQIHVPADFPEKYHDALVRVADKCLVKKTILNPPEFDIKTVIG